MDGGQGGRSFGGDCLSGEGGGSDWLRREGLGRGGSFCRRLGLFEIKWERFKDAALVGWRLCEHRDSYQ